jgi:AcrR family transcriptional regulator
MSADARERRPGREASMEAMLDAAEMLFARGGFAAVSVRDIAREAGVSHALVHRYLGSKDEVYRAVLRRNEERILAAAPDDPDLLDSAGRMFREGFVHHRDYLRILAYSALQGRSFDDTMGRFAATERLVELALEASAKAGERGETKAAPDPRLVVAAVVALFLGWVAVGEWLVAAAGVRDMEDDALVDQLEEIILGVLRLNIPGLDRPAGV